MEVFRPILEEYSSRDDYENTLAVCFSDSKNPFPQGQKPSQLNMWKGKESVSEQAVHSRDMGAILCSTHSAYMFLTM